MSKEKRIVLSKDECRILSVALSDCIMEFIAPQYDKDKAMMIRNILHELSRNLADAGDDKRRYGRTTANDFMDVLVRYSKAKMKVKVDQELKRIANCKD